MHVRNVPDSLYHRIQGLAEQTQCSLTTEVIQLLQIGLEQQELQQKLADVLSRIRNKRSTSAEGTASRLELLREDLAR